MNTPTRNTDIHGRHIDIGVKVRSFDSACRFEDGTLDGMDLEGRRASFVTGVVTGYTHLEGCERYVVAVATWIANGKEREIIPEIATVFPPVNGVYSMGGRTLGVVVLED